jgi:hypothetical protein
MSLGILGFSILGLFSSWKPGGPAESSPEGDLLFTEAASAFILLKTEDSNSSGAAKDASLSAMAAAVFLGSSSTTPTVAGIEEAGCCGCNWADIGLTAELCINTDVCSDRGAFIIGLELNPAPLIIGATPRRCLSCLTCSASARATEIQSAISHYNLVNSCTIAIRQTVAEKILNQHT